MHEEAAMRRSTMFASMALGCAAAAILLVGCKQTRPVPRYEPMLALQANQNRTTGTYRPAWAQQMQAKPAPRKGGG